jgi:hypothetical protein
VEADGVRIPPATTCAFVTITPASLSSAAGSIAKPEPLPVPAPPETRTSTTATHTCSIKSGSVSRVTGTR